MVKRVLALLAGAIGLLLATTLVGVAGPAGASPASSHVTSAKQGSPSGSLKVTITGGEWPNLDPALDNEDALDSQMLNAIYGGLFDYGPKGKIIPDLASGYTVSNGGMTVDINIRPGVTFSDGTPFTAQDVASSINRVLLPQNGCICLSNFSAVKSIAASGPSTVVLTMARPFAPIIQAFNGTGPNWVVDPTALSSMGTTAYGQKPVGAGPFMVTSNAANSSLQLTANPRYWRKGFPLLKNLSFLSVGSDQSAYSALQAGQAQMATLIATIPLLKQAMHGATGNVRVLNFPATFYEFMSLNETVAPFNNILAREAIYYATDSNALVTHLYGGLYKTVQSPTAQGETFYIPKVPGYRTYNLAKAKALVKQLGGLSVTMTTTSNTQFWNTEAQALQAMWQRAGIKVNIRLTNLEEVLAQLKSNDWQALDSNWGGADPAIAMPTYFSSKGPFTGIHDPTLDNLMNQAAVATSKAQRLSLYKQVAQRMNQQAEAPFMYTKTFYSFALKSVHGIPTNQGNVPWWQVSVKA
ncbi:MAG: ABC transporter substrate-binding protein [Acidimicrobiales bacterium]|nr:ABC transporter substrate-binding protein [Acidimicrobiales bacterium]MBO0893795.1 ABC transporter substrate-binding protein [Acidimicrobiales bacterium]